MTPLTPILQNALSQGPKKPCQVFALKKAVNTTRFVNHNKTLETQQAHKNCCKRQNDGRRNKSHEIDFQLILTETEAF
jgi:hypothetical protein